MATITDQVRNQREWSLHKRCNKGEGGRGICRTGVIFVKEEITLGREDGH
jgi:hypothetical protein